MVTKKPKGLGRGLEALLGADAPGLSQLGKNESTTSPPNVLSVTKLQAGKYQPRTRMDEGALAELADSIRAQGIMQPILVRPLDGTKVPVLVREVADEHAAAMALIENIQREDLNPLEEAQGVKRLLDEFGLTHEQAATAIGRSRSATSNLLRLLNLATPLQTMLLAGDIDMGHARALLAVDSATQIQLANQIIAKGLSVREAEKLVARAATEASPKVKQRVKNNLRDVVRLEEILSDQLGTKVTLKVGTKGRGQLVIDFHGWDHCSALIEKMQLKEELL